MLRDAQRVPRRDQQKDSEWVLCWEQRREQHWAMPKDFCSDRQKEAEWLLWDDSKDNQWASPTDPLKDQWKASKKEKARDFPSMRSMGPH